jgi:hypothetical protein
MVDRERPGESPLLTAPTRPHGTVKSAIFTTRETNQYKQLVAWVYQVSNQAVPIGSAAVAEAQSAPVRRTARRQHPRRKEPRSANDPAEGGKESQAADEHSLTGNADEAEAVDPFDPEVFNRRFQPAEPD